MNFTASDLVELIKARIDVTDGKIKAGFVISRAIKNTKLGREVVAALEGYDLPILHTMIYQRQIYPSSAASGLAVADCSKEQGADEAAFEIRQLAKEALGLIGA